MVFYGRTSNFYSFEDIDADEKRFIYINIFILLYKKLFQPIPVRHASTRRKEKHCGKMGKGSMTDEIISNIKRFWMNQAQMEQNAVGR